MTSNYTKSIEQDLGLNFEKAFEEKLKFEKKNL
jgi:hypothetical protein